MKDRIHLGSCHSQHHPSRIWPAIAARNGSAWVWIGDAVYGDDFQDLDSSKNYTMSERMMQKTPRDGTPSILQDLYRDMLQSDGYTSFLQRRQPIVLGTIDDHDYGRNNGDKTFPYRKETAQALLDFIQESNAQPVSFVAMRNRIRQGKGIYGVKVLDFSRETILLSDEEAGIDPDVDASQAIPLSDRSVAIFTLDVRSNKTPWPKKVDFWKSSNDPDGDFLGEDQWQWLEKALRRSTASVNVIAQGLQIHADKLWSGHIAEEWSRFPRAQHRLYQALLAKDVQAPILISGDVHMAQFLRRDCRKVDGSTKLKRALFEMTTSGMTHSWGTALCARPLEGIWCRSPFVRWAVATGFHWAHRSGLWTDLISDNPSAESGASRGVQYSLEHNFGELEFDWDERKVIARVLGEDATQDPILSMTWEMRMLSGQAPVRPTGILHEDIFGDRADMLAKQSIVSEGDWICVNNRGQASPASKAFAFGSSIFITWTILTLPLVILGMLGGCAMLRMKKTSRQKSKLA